MDSEHGARIDAGLCTAYRSARSQCSRCKDCCPAEAVDITPRGPRISERCVGCGVCFGACPNGALAVRQSDEEAILRMVSSTASGKKALPLRISCRTGDPSADVVLPCLARLTESLLLAPFKAGVAAIELLQPVCSDCRWGMAAPLIAEVVSRVRNLLEMIGFPGDSIVFRATVSQPAGELPENPLSRRRLLGRIGAIALKAAVEAIPVIPDRNPETNRDEEFQKNLRQRNGNEKRRLLIETLQSFQAAKTVTVPITDALFAELEVTDRCTGCKACATLCPTGALAAKESGDRFFLNFSPHLCTNCHLCQDVCRHGALRIQKETMLNRLFERGESVLFQSGKKVCRVCELSFVGGRNGVCPLCSMRIQKQNDMVGNLTIAET